MRHDLSFLCLLVSGVFSAAQLPAKVTERQLTHSPQGHMLTNTSVWSPDGKWIVYDTRKTSDRFNGTRIEQVNVETGEVRCLYESRKGAACGVATCHPTEPKVVFILGPKHPTAGWSMMFAAI